MIARALCRSATAVSCLPTPCEPSWALAAAIAAIGMLLVLLMVSAIWPFLGRRRIGVDPHGEAYGDQPEVPK